MNRKENFTIIVQNFSKYKDISKVREGHVNFCKRKNSILPERNIPLKYSLLRKYKVQKKHDIHYVSLLNSLSK